VSWRFIRFFKFDDGWDGKSPCRQLE